MAEITLTARGPAGANGLNLYTETRNPLPEDGRDNESWLNTRSLTLFKKQAGIWGSIASLAPAAPKPGTPGASGKTIYSDEGPPATELGTSGDFYVQKSAGIGIVMYGPKAGSVWGDPVALVTMIVGTGAPPNTTGVNGQVFVDVAGSTFYGPKAAGAWPTGVSLVGLLTGVGAPDPALGVNGQAYLDTQNAVLYAKKAGGLWAATGTTLRGLLTGAGAPGNALGFDGQTYVDTVALAFYGPKANGAWPAPTPLVGLISGAGAPGAGIGLNGQFYFDTAAFALYGPKAGGAWPAGAAPFVGLITGAGAPAAGVGLNGQVYLDLTASALYGPKAGGAWPAGPAPLVGLLTGSGAPGNVLGLNGQIYLDVANFALYGPKAGGAWPAGSSFVGKVPFKPVAAWATGKAYVPGPPADYVQVAGSSYACLVAHTSGTFATDLAANRWGLVAAKGADGTGAGSVSHSGSPAAGNLARFADATGDLIADAGVTGLEALLPVQTVAAASKAYAAADVYAETRRTNGGAAMTDTLPPASTANLVNGSTLRINNADTAGGVLTIQPGAGTMLNLAAGSVASITVEAGRSILFVYDKPNTAWRPTANSLTSILTGNKATMAQAQVGSDDAAFMTPAKTAAAIAALVPVAPSLDDFRTALVRIAKLTGSAIGLAGGVADDFRDSAGLSLNTTESVQSLPAMTSATAPSGHVASASSTYSSDNNSASYGTYLAFDGTIYTDGGSNPAWYSGSQSAPWWIQRKAPAAITVMAYRLNPRSSEAVPNSWDLLGSNDGSAWTTLDSRSGISWSNYNVREFSVTSPGSYLYYRLNIKTANGGATSGYVSISELQLLQGTIGDSANTTYDGTNNVVTNIVSGSPAALDVRSQPFAAQAVPTKGSIFALVKATAGAITANTNLLAKLSRDGGTTYTTAALVKTGTLSTGYDVYEANGFDISGQPSGSSMKWRLQTIGTALGVAVDAVVAQWG